MAISIVIGAVRLTLHKDVGEHVFRIESDQTQLSIWYGPKETIQVLVQGKPLEFLPGSDVREEAKNAV